MIKRLMNFSLVLSMLALGGVALGSNALERVKKAGKLLVAVDPTYPPMESEGPDGKPVGFDVEFARLVAERLGVNAEFVTMNWDGILAGLNSKRYDIIISCMNITEERKKQVDFVEYLRMSQLFVARKGTTVANEKDLAGKVVGVQADTTSYQFVEAQRKAGIAVKDLKAFRLATDIFAALKAGQVDVIVVDEPVGRYYVKQDAATFTITGRALAPEPVGIAIRRGDQDLRQAIESAVETMRKDGTLKKLSETWFGGELGA